MILGLRTAICHPKDLDAARGGYAEVRDLVRLLRQYTMTLGITSRAMVAGLAGVLPPGHGAAHAGIAPAHG